MKLIELLVRDLKEWPADAEHVVQDGDGEIKFGSGGFPYRHDDDSKVWVRDISCEIRSRDFPLADDWNTAIVTHDEWETAMYSPTPTTPTLETMLAEWRDLEARAQAAQAEADALFEHAGQCHGEIVVRLAELGWGAPRAPMVAGEPVVTLDDSDGWIEWKGGVRPVPSETIIDVKHRDGDLYESIQANSVHSSDWSHDGSDGDIVAYRLTPSTQP